MTVAILSKRMNAHLNEGGLTIFADKEALESLKACIERALTDEGKVYGDSALGKGGKELPYAVIFHNSTSKGFDL